MPQQLSIGEHKHFICEFNFSGRTATLERYLEKVSVSDWRQILKIMNQIFRNLKPFVI